MFGNVKYGDKSFRYFIGYIDDDVVRPLFLCYLK